MDVLFKCMPCGPLWFSFTFCNLLEVASDAIYDKAVGLEHVDLGVLGKFGCSGLNDAKLGGQGA